MKTAQQETLSIAMDGYALVMDGLALITIRAVKSDPGHLVSPKKRISKPKAPKKTRKMICGFVNNLGLNYYSDESNSDSGQPSQYLRCRSM